VFTARYALSPYIKQTRFVFEGLRGAKGGVYSDGQMSSMRWGGGGGDQTPSAVEVPRNAETETGDPEQKMATCQRGSSNEKNIQCQKRH
jgi:hypothetical protein